MRDRYSDFGPEPRLPSDMLRSLLVSVEFKITSYTRFAADLKENHLHAIISGFSVSDTPGIGTFYDFHRRLWLSDNKNLSQPLHPPKVKPQNSVWLCPVISLPRYIPDHHGKVSPPDTSSGQHPFPSGSVLPFS